MKETLSKLFSDQISVTKKEIEIIGKEVEKLKEENRLLKINLEMLNKELGK